MVVSLAQIREELLPGLWEVSGNYSMIERQWNRIFAPAINAPHIWVPKLTLPQAVLVGAAATIIKNPTITRRFWSGWSN